MSENLDAVDRDKAIVQWRQLVNLLRQCGAEVRELDCSDPRIPDVTFIANAGSFIRLHPTYPYSFITSKFRYDERTPEEAFFVDQMEWAGANVFPPKEIFEGDGDLLRIGSMIIVGNGFRTSTEFIERLERSKIPALQIKLVDPRFYHLDTCFFWHRAPWTDFSSPPNDICWYYPKAFSMPSLRALRQHLHENDIVAYEVSESEAKTFCCNAVGVNTHIVGDTFSKKLKKYITERGFEVHETSLSEFKKAGGSAKCLTLRVPRSALFK